MKRHDQIGFSSQKIRYRWLVHTADMCISGVPDAIIVDEIRSRLSALAGDDMGRRSSREKAVTILRKVWVKPRKHVVLLRDSGLKLLLTIPKENHMAIHWGMIMSAYPFWARVAAETGRLLRLQSSLTAQQVRRRLLEQYGDREIVARAARNVLRSFVEWGVLKETSEKGIYTAGLSLDIAQVELIAWLAEAYLHAHPNDSVALRTFLDSTPLFPFRLSPVSADHLAAVSGRLEVLRHGLDQDLIMLRQESRQGTRGGDSGSSRA